MKASRKQAFSTQFKRDLRKERGAARGHDPCTVDGQIVLQTLERRVPSDFVLACSSSAAPSCEYRDMLIYRSASNGDEVAFLADDTRPTVLQASLEVYAPLTNSSHLAANLAQSLSEVILNG